MKTRFLSVLAVSAALLAPAQALQTDDPLPALIELQLNLKDGSKLKASPVSQVLSVNPRLAGTVNLQWEAIKSIDLKKGRADAVLLFANGDRLTAGIIPEFIQIDCSLGRLKVPVESITKLDIAVMGGMCHNVALGKPVHGRDGASHGKGLAKHVTDGDPTTHAKPPSSNFDYRVDLQNGTDATFTVNSIVINWGRFGDKFVGIRQKGSEEWVSAAWPAEYVTSYTIECRKAGQKDWQKVHHFNGRPVDEKAANIVLIKQPAKDAGCSSESITCIQGLQLEGVAEVRVRASGQHWIGLYELEAHGFRE